MRMWKGKNFVPKIGKSISCHNLLQFHELFHAADQWKDAFLVEHIYDYLGKEYTVYIDLGYLFSVQNLRSKGQRTWTWWSSTWTCSTRQRQRTIPYRTMQSFFFRSLPTALSSPTWTPRTRSTLRSRGTRGLGRRAATATSGWWWTRRGTTPTAMGATERYNKNRLCSKICGIDKILEFRGQVSSIPYPERTWSQSSFEGRGKLDVAQKRIHEAKVY